MDEKARHEECATLQNEIMEFEKKLEIKSKDSNRDSN